MVARRLAPALLAAAVVALSGACSPCDSLTGCTDRAHLTITGRVLHEQTGAPAAGALVDFIRTGGLSLETDSIRAVADSRGLFTLRVSAATSGLVEGRMALSGAGANAVPFSYHISGLVFRTFADVGEANVLPVWSTMPTLPDIAMIVGSDFTPDALAGLAVEFRRTGGVGLLQGDVFRTVTRPGGVFDLFGKRITPRDAGEVIGDLDIPALGFRQTGVRIPATPEFRRNALMRLVNVGPR